MFSKKWLHQCVDAKISNKLKFIVISRNWYRKKIRSNNEVLNSLKLAKQFKLKYQFEQSHKPIKEAPDETGNAVMIKLPRTISEAELIINTYLESNLFVIFTDSLCPFCHHTLHFLNTLKIEYENIELDAFGNKQLLQNYLQKLCDNKQQSRCAPVAFVRNEDGTNGMYLIGANGIAQSWQNEKIHEFYPWLIPPNEKHERYLNGECDINDWKQITRIQSNMTSSFGYKSPSLSTRFSQFEPHPKTVREWSEYVGMPILAKDMGNPQRPLR